MLEKSHRPQLRQHMVDRWFEKFVEGCAYEKYEYHDFCKDVKHMNEYQIKEYYHKLV